MMRVSLVAQSDLPVPCPSCGYDLRAASSRVCPECGIELDEEAFSSEAAIPWQHRQHIGRARALLRTLVIALRQPVQLAHQAHRDVDFHSARLFWVICTVVAWLILLPLCFFAWFEIRPVWPDSLLVALADGSIVLALAAGLFLWLLTATGVPSLFFQIRSLEPALQDRGVALAYYSAAPLLLAPAAGILTLLVGLALNLRLGAHPLGQGALLMFAGSAWLLILAACVVIPLVLLSRGMRASGARLLACAITTGVGWVALFGVFVVGLPALALYAQLVYYALR